MSSMASAAAKLTAAREINLQQQITSLKKQVALASNEHELLCWQDRYEQAQRQITDLQQEKQEGNLLFR